ncbi:MAG TPA: hypothetical protein VJ751_02090 [Pyrinomonadaceae bacterium]|jgi:hypothetical protein|nr:hypothetical protein [Pyrinomonadaceae bacterium]
MKSSIPTRVNYFDRQFLRRNEFADEQSYQIDLRRRHNISHHGWGIVTGLEIVLEEEKLVVRPGLAVDGYGRELFLPAKRLISVNEFIHLGSNRLDVWLFYENTENNSAPSGYISCSENDAPAYRTSELPRLFFERARVSNVDARRPRGVPSGILDSPSQLRTVDDPLVVWPVYLGRVTYVPTEPDPLKQFVVDNSNRPYASVVAETVDHPAHPTRLMLGPVANGDERTIGDTTYRYSRNGDEIVGIYVTPPDLNNATQVTLEPRFSIDDDGRNSLRGSTSIQGNLQLVGGALQFTQPTPVEDVTSNVDPSIYRARDAGDELRIDLGKEEEAINRKFVIGFSSDDGSFRPAVTLEYLRPPGGASAQPLLTIDGDLTLNGLVNCPDLIRRSLNEETLAALLASFQAGSIAAGGQ